MCKIRIYFIFCFRAPRSRAKTGKTAICFLYFWWALKTKFSNENGTGKTIVDHFNIWLELLEYVVKKNLDMCKVERGLTIEVRSKNSAFSRRFLKKICFTLSDFWACYCACSRAIVYGISRHNIIYKLQTAIVIL